MVNVWKKLNSSQTHNICHKQAALCTLLFIIMARYRQCFPHVEHLFLAADPEGSAWVVVVGAAGV